MKPTAEDIIKEVIRSSTASWFETFGRIHGKDRSKGLIKPKCNYLQKKIQRVVDKFTELELPVRIMILKPRQKGSTTFGAALDYTMLRRSPTSAVIIGGQVSQVDEAYAMLQTYQKSDGFEWKNTGEINSKSGTWSHGSRLIRETAGDARAGIGGTHQALHAFEVARWPDTGANAAGETLSNIMKCVPLLPGTLINLESTAEGASGPFYNYWCNATDAEDFLSGVAQINAGQFVRCFAAWFQFDDSAMRLTPEQKYEIEKTLDSDENYTGERELIEKYGVRGDDGILRLGETVKDFDVWEQLAWRRWAIDNECQKDALIFNRDYPHSWQDAFQKSGNSRFSATGLAEIRRRASAVAPMHGILEETRERRVAFRSTSPGEAKVIIFEKPTKGMRYILGVDPMTGITQAGGKDPDYHSVFVLRDGYYDEAGKWHPPATAARIVRNRWDIPILEPEVWKLARMYGSHMGCTIVVEMNQDRGVTELLKLRGANLYRREQFNKTEQTTTKAYGFVTNEKTRENLVEKLAGAIRNINEVGNGIDILDAGALEQFDNFVRKANGRSEAAEGFKDDDVFGIGLAFEVIGHATTYHPPVASAWYQPPPPGGAPRNFSSQNRINQYS